jgi:hypothetical protein
MLIDKKQVTQIGFVYEIEKGGSKMTVMRSRLPNVSMV